MSDSKKQITKKQTVTKQQAKKQTTSKAKTTGNNILNKIKMILNKIKNVVLKFLKKHWDLILMNIIIFILTVFVESQYIYNLKLLAWFFNAVLFIVVPTLLFSLKRNIRGKDIIISIPILYILFLIFLDYCTIRELYGISTLGIDTFPNYIDALMVVFVFTFFEYITVALINKFKINKTTHVKKKIKK